MKGEKRKKKKTNTIFIIGVALTITIIVSCFFAFSSYSPFNRPEKGEETPTVGDSTVSLYSQTDGEDVSGLEYIELYLAKSSAEFEDWQDIRNIALNFELETRKLAEDLTFDLTGEQYAWLRLCPPTYGSGVFNEDWKLIYGEANSDYGYYVTDDPTELNFNIVDKDLDEITVADHATNGTYMILFDVEHNTTTAAQLHVGTGWEMSDSEFDELTTTQQKEYYDEAKWASFDPLYNPDNDTMTITPRYDIEQYTDCPAFKFIFNDTGVDIDLDSDVDAIVIADGVNIYIIFYDTLCFIDGVQSLEYEITYPADVVLSDVDFGRAIVTKGASLPPTSFIKVSDITS